LTPPTRNTKQIQIQNVAIKLGRYVFHGFIVQFGGSGECLGSIKRPL
jgi:hypothetical protein